MLFKGLSNLIPARVSLAILCATGVMELYMTRTNLSIAIVAMVFTVNSESAGPLALKVPYCLREDAVFITNIDETYGNSSNTEYVIVNATNSMMENLPPIQMTSTQRGNVLSAFFYAYGISGVFGGRLSEIYGTKKVFGAAVMVDAIGNFLIPAAAKTNYGALFGIRFIMGCFRFQGACYPAMNSAISKWIPSDEVSRFIGFSFNANSFGTIFTLSFCGIIISELGWEYVFYICGCISLVWVIFWSFLMFDSPEEHPRITLKEKNYIIQALTSDSSKEQKAKKVPWCNILASVPLWAQNVAHAGNMFGLSFLATQLPLYMSSIIGVNVRKNGLLSSLPFLARFIGSNVFSWLSIYLMKRMSWNQKTWTIILTVIGFTGPGISVILVGYVGCGATVAVLSLFVVGMFLNGASSPGYGSNYIFLSPNYAATIFGFSSTIGFLYAMVGPVIVGALIPEETISEWITVYWIVFGSYFATAAFFCIFSSTEVQHWNEGKMNADHASEVEFSHEQSNETTIRSEHQKGTNSETLDYINNFNAQNI